MKNRGKRSDKRKITGEALAVKLNKESLLKRVIRYRWLYLFLLPAVIWYIIFAYLPIYGISIAFKDYNIMKGVFASDWIGFDNFIRIYSDANFSRALRNTLIISGLKLIFVTPIGLILALLLYEIKNRFFNSFVQSLSMLTHFFSWVVIASIMTVMLSPNSGVVNKIIEMFGGKAIYFLAEEKWFLFWLVASDMWESAGWNALIFIAAIAGISPELYEASSLDGAGRFKQLLHVTLPCIAPTICTVLLLKIGGLLSGNFNQVFNLYNSAVMNVADILDTYVYRLGIKNMQYSYSSAVNLFQNVIGLILVLSVNKIVKKVGQEGII